MGGKMSRNKGARNERLLVQHLNDRGFTALRVPLSGAMKGYKHDVEAVKGGVSYPIELKVRATEYNTIYHLFNVHKDANNVVRVADPESQGLVMSDDIEKLDMSGNYPSEHSKAFKKLIGMKKLLNGAEYLAIRGDRLGFLFIRYL